MAGPTRSTPDSRRAMTFGLIILWCGLFVKIAMVWVKNHTPVLWVAPLAFFITLMIANRLARRAVPEAAGARTTRSRLTFLHIIALLIELLGVAGWFVCAAMLRVDGRFPPPVILGAAVIDVAITLLGVLIMRTANKRGEITPANPA